MIKDKVMVLIPGPMEINILANMKMIKEVVMEKLLLPMETHIQVITKQD
jgi:hypothetical protein